MTKKILLILLAIITALLLLATASATQRWIQGSKTEFLKGDPESASVTSSGEIVLPPAAEKLFSTSEPFIWDIAVDNTGKFFAAGGNEGIIYDPNGNPLYDSKSPAIYTMAFGPDNRLYFGTSPNGSIYRMGLDGKPAEFFQPKYSVRTGSTLEGPPEKYIWDMVFDSMGNLYVATGLEGRVYKVSPDGKGTVIFDSDEANITCITIDNRGRILFGSDPGGQIFQLSPNGQVFVLFDSELKEINNIVTTADGDIYASGIAEGAIKEKADSEKDQSGQPAPLLSRTGSISVSTSTDGSSQSSDVSAIFKIYNDGNVEKVWLSSSQLVYALTLNSSGELVFGTGPEGSLSAIDKNGNERVLRRLEGDQITALTAYKGLIYAGVSNLGGVYQISSRYENKGVFLSQVKDTGTTSSFGAIRWNGSGSRIFMYSRSGNTSKPDNTWSPWSSPYSDPENSKIASPPARFIQWKAELTTSEPENSPALKSVSIYYLQNNVKPRVNSVAVLPTGITFKPGMDDPDARSVPPEVVNELKEFNINASPMPGMGRMVFSRQMRTLLWRASDSNNDELVFNILYRSASDNQWAPLLRGHSDNYYTFDTRILADGTYVARIEAEDYHTNSKERALKGWLDSQPFDVDNSPPAISGLQVTASGSKVKIIFTAADSFSTIKITRVKLDTNEWLVVLPQDGISDSRNETFSLEVEAPAAGDHLITVQVLDELYNSGAASARITTR